MYKRLDKYLKDRLKDLVFIELKKDAKLATEKFKDLRDIYIPIRVDELGSKIKDGSASNEMNVAGMARGMIYLIGLDAQFKYAENYKRFLYQFDNKIEQYIAYEALKKAEEEKYEEAMIYFRALSILNEDDINGLFNYARCCQDLSEKVEDKKYKKDLKNECIEALEIITEKYPDFAMAYYYLGFRYANAQLFKKAQLTWEKSLTLDLDDEKRKEIILQIEGLKHQIQYEEGYTLILNNQPNVGLEKLLPLADVYPEWWNLLFFVGLAYRQMENPKEAIHYFERIYRLKPTQVDNLNELGLCYGTSGDYENAEKYFKKALQFKEDGEILCNLAMVYMENNKLDLATDVLEKAKEMNPEDLIMNQCVNKLNEMKKQ